MVDFAQKKPSAARSGNESDDALEYFPSATFDDDDDRESKIETPVDGGLQYSFFTLAKPPSGLVFLSA